MRYFLWLIVSILISCTQKSTESTSRTSFWVFKGAFGGYVPSVVFHPTNSCEVWASGDDMSGLYKSTDCGVNWSLVSTPKNMSTYSLEFAPGDAEKMYAVSHFGWGVLKSVNGGASWSLSQSGLPSVGTNKHVYQTAINPTLSSTLVVATDDGLYKSTDSGSHFSKITTAWGASFKAVVYSSTGRLFAGATNGVLKYSDNNGATWSDVLTGSVGLSKLVVSAHALYILFSDATLMYVTLPSFGSSGVINNPATDVATGLQTAIAVSSGSSQATDLIYLGTSKNNSVAVNRWGLFKSSTGGASWTQMGSALSGQSIFSIAIDPLHAGTVLVGSTNSSGIFKTVDGGVTWVASSSGIQSNSVLGFSQNPLDTDELVMSSTVGLGLGQSYSSLDGGATWSVINEVNSTDGVVSWSFDPMSSGVVLAGMMTKGLYRSTTGVSGAWARVIATDTKVDRIVRDGSSSAVVYALARDGSVSGDVRVYYSNNSGTSFTKRALFFAVDLATHPSNLNEAVMVSTTDGFVSSDGFATGNSLGLSTQAIAQGGLTAVTFNSADTSEVWVGGASGGLYRTTNYINTGVGMTWESINSPISSAIVQNILVRVESGVKTIYVSSFGADVYFSSGAVLGLWKSTNDGTSWIELSSSLNPCTSFWGFSPVLGSVKDLWGFMWGGGLFKLKYQ